MKYVQNVHNALIKCRIVDDDAPVVSGRPVPREFLFQPASTDRSTGRQAESGYTTLEDEEYDALMAKSKLFVHYTDKARRLLIVHDELPAEVQTPHDLLVSTRRELSDARAEIAELREMLQSRSTDKAAEAKVVELQAANTELQQQISKIGTACNEAEVLLAAIDPAVVEAAKKALADKEDKSAKAGKPAKEVKF